MAQPIIVADIIQSSADVNVTEPVIAVDIGETPVSVDVVQPIISVNTTQPVVEVSLVPTPSISVDVLQPAITVSIENGITIIESGGSTAWSDITGKPSTFPPIVPIAWADLSGVPLTFPPTTPIPYSDLSGAPTIPSLPITESDVTNLVTDLASKATLPIAESDVTNLSSDLSARVLSTDSRLSNARTPTAHASTHSSGGSDPVTLAESQITNLTTDLAARVLTSDSRLSDARTPTAHHTTHEHGGSDPVIISYADLSGIPSSFNPTLPIAESGITNLVSDLAGKASTSHHATHVHGGTDEVALTLVQITDAGSAAAKNAPTSGNASSGQVVLGSDTRLTDSRTPTAHHTTHEHGGSDPVIITYSDLLSIPSTFAPSAHHASHEHGGSDAVTILYSDLASIPSTFAPSAHHASHEHGGSDAVSITFADLLSVPVASATVKGIAQVDGTTITASSGVISAVSSAATAISTQSSAYTVLSTDIGKYFICSGGSWALTLPNAATVGNGFVFFIRNDMGITGTTGTITITPVSSQTIDGATTLSLLPQQYCQVISDGSNWRTYGLERRVVLGTRDITSSTANDTILLPAGFRHFKLIFENIRPVTASAYFTATVSNDGGSTFKTTGYQRYELLSSSATTAAYAVATADTYIYLFPAPLYATVGVPTRSEIDLPMVGPSDYPTWIERSDGYNNSGAFEAMYFLRGLCTGLTGPINALKYQMSTGNIAYSLLTVIGEV